MAPPAHVWAPLAAARKGVAGQAPLGGARHVHASHGSAGLVRRGLKARLGVVWQAWPVTARNERRLMAPRGRRGSASAHVPASRGMAGPAWHRRTRVAGLGAAGGAWLGADRHDPSRLGMAGMVTP